jgi:hypothetical protein
LTGAFVEPPPGRARIMRERFIVMLVGGCR